MPCKRKNVSSWPSSPLSKKISQTDVVLGGVIVKDDVMLPTPDTCYPRYRGPVKKTKHNSLDVKEQVKKYEEKSKKPQLVPHVYTYSELSDHLEEPKQKGEKSRYAQLKGIKKKLQNPVFLPFSELQELLEGCNVTYATWCAYSDYCLVFSDKEYARKNLFRVVKALNDYRLNKETEENCFDIYIIEMHWMLSIRITLRGKYSEQFYHEISQQFNRLAIGSADLPFPRDYRSLSDAQKKQLLYLVLVRILGEQDQQLPDNLFPTHVPGIRNQIWRKHSKSLSALLFHPVDEDEIFNYFGAEVAFYFAWMNHYERWLIGAAVVGLVTGAAGKLCNFSTANSPFVPFYTMLVILGSVLLVKTWERRCKTLFMRFNMYHNQRKDEKNWKLKGQLVINKLSNKPELYYPSWRRYTILWPITFLVSLAYLSIAMFFSLCSANLDGIFDEGCWFYFPSIRKYTLPGEIFGPESSYSWVPQAAYPLLTVILGKLFSQIARKLTEFENYEYRGDYVRSVTQKRISLETILRYSKLLWALFFARDFTSLTASVRFIFLTDEAIRLGTEAFLPFVTTYKSQLLTVVKTKVTEVKELDENFQKYEIYEDFVQVALQLGYLVLFATVYPVAPLVAALSNKIEMKADLFKLCYIVRRPVPRYGFPQLGVWRDIFSVLAIASVLTNAFLFAFDGSQMQNLLPGSVSPEKGINNESIIWFVFLEHIILVLCGCIYWYIPEQPKKVKDYLKRKSYLNAREQGIQF